MNIIGAHSVNSLKSQVLSVYKGRRPDGVHCGYPSVNFTLVRKRLCILTGIPSSGKSNWWDTVMLNTAATNGHHWIVFSPESDPIERHILGMAQKIVGKQFYEGGKTARMTQDELSQAMKALDKHFTFISMPDEITPSVVNVCDTIEKVIKHKRSEGIDVFGIVIDPYNELDHARSQFEGTKAMNETEYVSFFLSYLKRWTKRNNIFTCLVAHPTKLQKRVEPRPKENENPYPCPTPYDVAGSQAFRSKGDVMLAVHRPLIIGRDVHVHVQKIRHQEDGELCVSELLYEKESERYVDMFDRVHTNISLGAFFPEQIDIQESIPF